MPDPYELRLRRIAALPLAPAAAGFLQGVADFQRRLLLRLRDPALQGPPERMLESVVGFVPALLDWLSTTAPDALADHARALAGLAEPDWIDRLKALLREGPPEDPLEAFIPRLLAEPWLLLRPAPEASGIPDRCPRCGGPPGISILREDPAAETVRRTLSCSLCALEWPFPRVVCPGCREENPDRLPRLSAEELPWLRIEACDACRGYLKSVDFTRDAAADPWVDELAYPSLDVAAREADYRKLCPNLFGL
jgi:FdhE protein